MVKYIRIQDRFLNVIVFCILMVFLHEVTKYCCAIIVMSLNPRVRFSHMRKVVMQIENLPTGLVVPSLTIQLFQ